MNQERLKARDEAAEEYALSVEWNGENYGKRKQYYRDAFSAGWDAAMALAEKEIEATKHEMANAHESMGIALITKNTRLEAEIERLREALKKYSSDSMRIGSTVTPKWADEALEEEKVSTKPDLPFPGQRYCPHGQDEYYCFECHPYGAYAKKEKK